MLRVGQEKLILTLSTTLSIIGSFLFVMNQNEKTLTTLLIAMMIILFQLRTGIVQLVYKRYELTFHRFKPLNYSVLVDLIASLLYMNVFPLVMLRSHYLIVPVDQFEWIFSILYTVYIICLSLNFWAETQRFLCKHNGEAVNYRLVGLWRSSWNFNYFTETLIVPLMLFASTRSLLISLACLVLMIINFVYYQIPRNVHYIKNAYPRQAEAILQQSSYIPKKVK